MNVRINQHEADNSMTIQNLAIVFGPTLFGQMMPGNGINGQMNGMADAAHQNKASHLTWGLGRKTDKWNRLLKRFSSITPISSLTKLSRSCVSSG